MIWRNINTAEWFKTGRGTGKKTSDSSARGTATPPLRTGGRRGKRHQGGDTTLRFASKKKQSRGKTFGEFFASKASQSTCTAGTKNERGIWKYTTLSWWWVWFKQVRFQKSTLKFATAALVHGRPCAAATCEGFLDNAMQKTPKSCVLWYLPTKSRKDNVSEVLKTTYKYQSVPDHPATATQLSY